MKASAPATIEPTTTSPITVSRTARGRTEDDGASGAPADGAAARGRARRFAAAGRAGAVAEAAGFASAAFAGAAAAAGFVSAAFAGAATGAVGSAATGSSAPPSSASADTQSGVPSFQTSASFGILPSCRHACSVARSTGPYSVPSGRCRVYWGIVTRPSVDPEDVVAEDLHAAAGGHDRSFLEAGGIDRGPALHLLLERLDLGLEGGDARLRVVLHPVLGEDRARARDRALVPGEEPDVLEDGGADRHPLLVLAAGEVLLAHPKVALLLLELVAQPRRGGPPVVGLDAGRERLARLAGRGGRAGDRIGVDAESELVGQAVLEGTLEGPGAGRGKPGGQVAVSEA